MAPTPEQTKLGYHRMWDRAQMRSDAKPAAVAVAKKILANREKYQAVEKKTGVPWPMIGPIHNRESSLRFNAHLHCGDPLTARTYHVPKGRPAKGSPPFTWEESAIDALTMPPHSLDRVKFWSVERILYETEKYNGWGYLGKGNSPYLWAGTTEYRGGKYVADHIYDPNAWDKQLGCVAVLKALAELEPAVAERLRNRQGVPPPEVIEEQVRNKTRGARKTIAAGGAAVGAGAVVKTGTEAPKEPVTNAGHTYALPLIIALAAVAVGVAVISIVRKRQTVPVEVTAKWAGG